MKRKIILLENENIFHFLYSKVTEKDGMSIKILKASSGIEAIRLLNHHLIGKKPMPKVVFLVLSMPLMESLQFVEQLKRISFFVKDEISVVILTTHKNEIDGGYKDQTGKISNPEDIQAYLKYLN